MAVIKSAFEMAMERTKDVEADKESLEASTYAIEGKKIVSRFLGETDVKIKDELAGYDRKQLGWVKEGIAKALLANLVLPADEMGIQKARKVGAGFSGLLPRSRELSSLFSQLEDFFKEYVEEKERLRQAVEDQYRPKLQQKEQELSKQLGQPVKVDPASDPEFVAALRKNLANFDLRYEEVLTRVKEQIEGIARA